MRVVEGRNSVAPVGRFLAPVGPRSEFLPMLGRSGPLRVAKGKIGEAPAMLFGGLLVTMLGLAGLSRADTPDQSRRPFFIYLGEFQTFTTLALVNMLAELRKYGLGLVLANQFMDQIDGELRSAILGNVGTL